MLAVLRLCLALIDRALWALPSTFALAARRARLRASTPVLVLVAKYPTPGASKTRLAASGLGDARTAEVARAMLLDVLARHARAGPRVQRVLLFSPPDGAHADKFARLLREAGCAEGDWTLVPMRSTDARSSNLTAVLMDALTRVRARFAPVSTTIFIGADAPTVGEDAVRAAIVAGLDGRAHLCPAEDGGYTLLGVPADAPASIFAGVRWSAATTAISQAARLAEAGVRVDIGATFVDVDDAASFEDLREKLAADDGQRALCSRVWALIEHGVAAHAEPNAGAADAPAAAEADATAAEPLRTGACSDAAVVARAAQAGELQLVRGEAFGIGGLDEALQTIARRVLATRALNPALVERLRLRHTRGLLLHGPPGTGKTLAARALGRLLGCADERVRLVAGPELYNQYVGRSESNVRELFADAEREQREYAEAAAGVGDAGARAPPRLHMLIFDEIDALTARRADTDGGSGASVTGSLVLSQLLAKLDGLSPLNNIFVAGTTNRLDAIDEALLRPGRLELQLEIGLPAVGARAQILHIHTAPLRREGRLALDAAGLDALAALAVNYTGAELEAAVRAAVSRTVVGARRGAPWSVSARELEAGLRDVRPAFGDADGREALARMCARGAPPRAGAAPNDGGGGDGDGRAGDAEIAGLPELCARVRSAARGELGGGTFAVLVCGAGTDALARARTRAAVAAARAADAPLLRVLASEEPRLLGKRPFERAEVLARTVREAHRSPVSCVVLEHVDRLAGAHLVRGLPPCAGDSATPTAARVDFDRELLGAVVGALTAQPREPTHVCVLVCTCASDAACDALFSRTAGEDAFFHAVLAVGHKVSS
ncbi:hypothetical protein KFE25_010044 [Diacronema lutheri]|uniref:Vesicle-fusing ATPase n=1 Tax=Diacronema lutheri TaxID=2081491 RepID=A0A8J6CB20_DIALT|nr:hypothetical protein KFE25_010044 [Diacronema lutheri]